MPTRHNVQRGDCISSIAFKYGLFPDTIWDHPANAALKAKRQNPNVLADGDIVAIPDKRERTEQIETTKRHTFKRRGVPARLRLRLQQGGKPLANLAFKLNGDGFEVSGQTDGGGLLDVVIPPNATTGLLVIQTTPHPTEYDLDLGCLAPSDNISGMKARLNNLGLECGPVDETPNEDFRNAVRAFQAMKGLNPTGQPDAQTQQALLDEHDRH
jgi:peptidoglycan hydrolase-like protein with peptidoglycan-binding domain